MNYSINNTHIILHFKLKKNLDMFRTLTLLSFLIITSDLQGQTGKLIGKVLDENGLSMPGATFS